MSNTATAKEIKPFLEWGFEDISDDSFEWECFCDTLTEMMQKINPKGQWHCTVQNFGWRSLNGFKNLVATRGDQMLSGILPRTECRFRIFVEGKGFGRYFKIQNFHHDSPTGNEWYEVRRFNGRIHPAT